MNTIARTPDDWVQWITASWRESVGGIIETGRRIAAAKKILGHGEFEMSVLRGLPFTARTAQRLMAIAADERISANATRVSLLPASWGTIYELTKLDDQQLEKRFTDGTIRPDMERSQIANVTKAAHREKRETALGKEQRALPEKKYGVIYADPEWRFEPYSRDTGMDRAPENHYPTSSIDVICQRPVEQIAARDCVLFLWATVPMLPGAMDVMRAWGFEYKSQIVWIKDRIGTGYWFRNKHELLLVGTRGKIPAPAMGTQWPSVMDAPVGKHSEKPDKFYELIESYFPNLPKVELNARRAREGWDVWGLEAPVTESLPPHDPVTGELRL